jgi:hypothetical protein
MVSILAIVMVSGSALAASRGDPVGKFDTDGDGTVDVRELRGRLSAKEIAAADPDHDGTLSVNEYLAVVSRRFDPADPDHDGTLDGKELKTPAGRTLLQLLQ